MGTAYSWETVSYCCYLLNYPLSQRFVPRYQTEGYLALQLAVLPRPLLVPPQHTNQSLRLTLDLLGIQSEHRELNLRQTLSPLGKLAPVVPLLQLLVQSLLVVVLLLPDLLVAVVAAVLKTQERHKKSKFVVVSVRKI